MINEQICKSFNIIGDYLCFQKYGNGLINETFLLETNKNKYIIQRINNKIFKNPIHLMKNYSLVTSWLVKNDNHYKGIRLVKTKKNKNYIKIKKDYFRCYEYIANTTSYSFIDDLNIIYEYGKAIGYFDNILEDIPIKKLKHPIKDFHNGVKRYNYFKKVIKEDNYNLKNSVLKEIYFIYKRKKYFNIINKEIKKHTIRIVPTHNDPKINNMLIDNDTNKVKCLIDLDTVMPGTILYDYGDAMRSLISDCSEDEENLDNVTIDLDKFRVFTEGFLDSLSKKITNKERELLLDSIIIMTLECGMRFLTDYLENNQYFKIKYETQNLRRARVAFKQVSLIEENKKIMNEIVKKIGL